MGYILLAGGAEFGGQMAAPDQQAIARAGGMDVPIRIIPAAAAPDNNHQRAGANGVRWFQSLGARNVTAVPLIDTDSANDARIVDELRTARLIYLLGGFPGYLNATLAGSAAWQAMRDAYANGAVLAGSSAGAMVLCEHLYDPQRRAVVPALGLLANCCFLPHYNTFGKGWVQHLAAILPGVTLLGVDERTGMLDDGTRQAWHVYGAGAATMHYEGHTATHAAGTDFTLSLAH